jgi:hypothetical protein
MNWSEREFALMTISLLMVLTGCTHTRHIASAAEVCDAKPSDDWQMLNAPPEQVEEMMAVRDGERSIGELLNIVPDARSEAWFKSKAGVCRYCRFVPKVSTCVAQPEFVDFSLNNGRWQAEGPLETICMDGPDRRPSR